MIPRYNSGDTINLAVNVEKLIECTAIPATRFNVGVRPPQRARVRSLYVQKTSVRNVQF